MTDADIKIKCSRCLGTGSDNNNRDSEGNPAVEFCIPCNGVGYIAKDKIDTTDIMADLDKCKKRLKKIMDKLELID